MIEYTLEEEEYYEPSERERLLNLIKGAGLAVLLAGLISMLWTPILGILIAIMGGAVAAVAFYFGRRADEYDIYEDEEYIEEEADEEEYESAQDSSTTSV